MDFPLKMVIFHGFSSEPCLILRTKSPPRGLGLADSNPSFGSLPTVSWQRNSQHEGRRDDVLPVNIPSGYVKHSYGKWPFIVDFPIKNGGSFHSYVKLLEGTSTYCMVMAQSCWLIM